MQEAHSNKHPNNFDDEIDLRELFYVLLEGKWIIVSLTSFISIIGVIYSLLLPNIYESKTILSPVNERNSIAALGGQYGALAGIAGINLSASVEGNYAKAIEKITSLSFFENNIMPNIYLPDLMAVKSWNAETNTLVSDDSIFDTNSNTWVRDYSYPQQQIPSAQESFEVFKAKHLNLSENIKSGFTTLSIKHQSPFIAKQWAELVVNEVNAFYRQKDKLKSEMAVIYLNKQISLTSLSEIKEVLAQLLQEETKKLTLIEADQFYVFDYINPPSVMEKKSEPRRALICIIGFLLGGMLSTIIVFARHYFFIKK
jgi:LPS O-antigen subunit length determinant protein (WzzB/FepE family)